MAQDILTTTAHRPYPLAPGPWRMRQRWNDLLFAHWPVPAPAIQALLPPGLVVDTFDATAWLGVVPFWMDRVLTRLVGDLTASVPTTRAFSELNLRTYVRSTLTGKPGVFFFSLDASSLLAVLGARTLFHLPYFYADISRTQTPHGILYDSTRRLTPQAVRFHATYQPTGPVAAPSQPGTLAHFLTERYCLFTTFAGRLLLGEIHHLPWPLQPAHADIRHNQLCDPHGLTLPDIPPILHYARSLDVFIWPLRVVRRSPNFV